MRGGCIDRNSRRRPLVESSESESDDPWESGPLECRAKLEFGLEKEHIIDIAGRTNDQGRCSVGDGASGDDAGGRTAADAREEGTEV